MNKTFNLSKFKKQAYYEDGRGLTQQMTRACMNCQKAKRLEGLGAQDAWYKCIDEYNKGPSAEWSLKYSSH